VRPDHQPALYRRLHDGAASRGRTHEGARSRDGVWLSGGPFVARLCRRVYTIERYRTLLNDALKRFEDLRIHNITAKVGDGAKGWPEQAPFDRIIVTAAAPAVPLALVDQLKEGGLMIVPVATSGARGEQKLVRIERTGDGVKREELLPVRFVPLVEGVAKES